MSVLYISDYQFLIFHFNRKVMSKTSTRVRDAGSDKFVPGKEAEKRPETTVTEKIKVGPTKKRK